MYALFIIEWWLLFVSLILKYVDGNNRGLFLNTARFLDSGIEEIHETFQNSLSCGRDLNPEPQDY